MRAGLRANRPLRYAFYCLLAIGVAGALYGGTLAMFHTQMYLLRRTRPAERPTLAMALDALQRDSYLEARRLAESLDRSTLDAADQGGPDYVLGVVAAHEAGELWGPERKHYFLLAARYLKLARERKFEQAIGPTGTVLLGQSLYYAGRITASRPVLEEAIELAPSDATMIHRLLADAYRRKPKRNLEQALAHNRKYLEDADLSLSDRQAGLLQQANLLWQTKDYAACQKTLDEIPADAFLRAEVDLLRGRLTMRAARDVKKQYGAEPTEEQREEIQQHYQEAIKILRQAQDDPLGEMAIRQSMYLIGLCLLEMGDSNAALAQLHRTRSVYLDTQEGIAAGLDEADLLRALHRDDDALAEYRQVLGSIKEKPAFANRWIAPKKFRDRILQAFQYFLEGQHYEQAVQLAERMSPLFPQAQSMQLVAETYRSWARNEVRLSETLPEPQSSEKRKHGRELYRVAGKKFEHLAMIRFTERDYPDDVWQGAECYLSGHQFTAAVSMLEEYLKYELRRRRPTALVHLGEALLALGQVNEALEVLGECIEFYPTDAAGYEARLWAARAMTEKGEPQGAEKLLLQNLNGESLTPESKEWRDSLFALGKLLNEDGRYLDAIERLEEAVSRYPDARQAIEARYLIAESCLLAAKVPQEKAASDTGETARVIHRKQAAQLLERAIHYYRDTEQVLNRRQEQTELTPLEKVMLRNSYFSIGSALVDLGKWEEAIKAFSAAANRYQHDPEVLDAFTQISYCYRRLNKPREAQGTVRQAMLVLQRIKPDAPFEETTIYTRQQWEELLEWMSHL
ncbi:MAG TPA: tetratricopeptide repeat protein [Pirellulales bacterium]|nr:tetratricopeptide repeat protein [Pirellulales bacterium]